jgi:hypothetical protein
VFREKSLRNNDKTKSATIKIIRMDSEATVHDILMWTSDSQFTIWPIVFWLKGQCQEIFDLWFFHQTTPPGPLIHRWKPFCIWIRIRASSSTKSVPQRWQWHRWRREQSQHSWIRGVNDIAGATSAVSMTPLVPHQQCQLHKLCSRHLRCQWLRGFSYANFVHGPCGAIGTAGAGT